MTKQELKKFIKDYKSAEHDVHQLDKIFGISIWNAQQNNFYNKYNWIIHNLLVSIFGENKVEILEDYMFEQTDLSFDRLCILLEIEDETNSK